MSAEASQSVGASSARSSGGRSAASTRRGHDQWTTLPSDSVLVALRLACCTSLPPDAASAAALLRTHHPLVSDTAGSALEAPWPPGVMPHLGGFSALLDPLPVMREEEAEMLESGAQPPRLVGRLQTLHPLARLQEQVSVVRGGIALGADAQRIRSDDSEESEGEDSKGGTEGNVLVPRRAAVRGVIRAAGTMALSAHRARRRRVDHEPAATQRLLPHRHFASFDSSAMAVVPWIAPRGDGSDTDSDSGADLGMEAVRLTDSLRGVHAAADAAASAVRRLLEGPREEEAVPALPAPPSGEGDSGEGGQRAEGGEGGEEDEEALAARIEAMYGMDATSEEDEDGGGGGEERSDTGAAVPSPARQPAPAEGGMSERARQMLARTMGGGQPVERGGAQERQETRPGPHPRVSLPATPPTVSTPPPPPRGPPSSPRARRALREYAEARAIDAERLMGLVSAAAATAPPPADEEPRHWTAWRTAAAAWRPGSSPSYLGEVASLLRQAPPSEVHPARRDALCSVLEGAAAAHRAASPNGEAERAQRVPRASPSPASPPKGRGLARREHEANVSLVGGRGASSADRGAPESPVDKRLLPASIIESLTQEIQRAVTAASHMIVSDSTSEGEGGEGRNAPRGRRGKSNAAGTLARVGAPRRRVDWARDMTRLESLLLQLLPADRARALTQEVASPNQARSRPQRRSRRAQAPPPPPPRRATPPQPPPRQRSGQAAPSQQQSAGAPTVPVSLRVARRAAARAKQRQEVSPAGAAPAAASPVVREDGVPALSESQMGELSRHIPPELLHYLKEPLAPPAGAEEAGPTADPVPSQPRPTPGALGGSPAAAPGPSTAGQEDATSVSTSHTTSDATSRRWPRRRRGRSQSKSGRRSRSRSRSRSNSGSRSDARRSGQRDAEALLLGCRVELQDGTVGTVRYVGPTSFAPGQWLGLELDNAMGTCDGSARGVRYFTCRQSGSDDGQRGVFAPRAHVRRIVGVEDSDSERAEEWGASSPARVMGGAAMQSRRPDDGSGGGHARAGRELVGALAALAATPDAEGSRRRHAAQASQPTPGSRPRSGSRGDGRRRRGAPPPPPPPRAGRQEHSGAAPGRDAPAELAPSKERRPATQRPPAPPRTHRESERRAAPPPPPRRDASSADRRARVGRAASGTGATGHADQGAQFRWARDGAFGEQGYSPPAPPPSREATATESIRGVESAWDSADEAVGGHAPRAAGIEDNTEEGGMSDSELERLLQGAKAPIQ